MSIELLQAKTSAQQLVAQTVTLKPDARGTSAEAAFCDKQGTVKATLSPVLDTLEAEVLSVGTSPDLLTLTEASDTPVVGRTYWYVSGSGWACKVRVAEVLGSVVRLDSAPAGSPAAGDLLRGLEWTASIPGTALATRGKFFRVDWRVTGDDGPVGYRQTVAVVAMQFRPPATPDDAKRMALQHHKSWALAEPYGTWLRVAEDATQLVRTYLQKDEDYPHWIGDQDAFKQCGEFAIRIVLAGLGRIPPGFDGATFLTDQTTRMAQAIRSALGGVWRDTNEDDVVDAREVSGVANIAIERV